MAQIREHKASRQIFQDIEIHNLIQINQSTIEAIKIKEVNIRDSIKSRDNLTFQA